MRKREFVELKNCLNPFENEIGFLVHIALYSLIDDRGRDSKLLSSSFLIFSFNQEHLSCGIE
jgi:hypothetical protein